MRRKDFRQVVILSSGNVLGKPALYRVEAGGETLMIKDAREKLFPFRWSLGLWLIQKEWKIYDRLRGVKGVPRPVERIDRFAFAMEYIPGRPIGRGEPLPPSFFSQLEQALTAVHGRGVVHLDLRHKGNILVSEKGEPYLIDFNSGMAFREKGLLRSFLFPLLTWVDAGGLLKLKERIAPAMLTPEERRRLERINRLRKWWIFN
jgi:predicted Ser/Thr protein kinase